MVLISEYDHGHEQDEHEHEDEHEDKNVYVHGHVHVHYIYSYICNKVWAKRQGPSDDANTIVRFESTFNGVILLSKLTS